MILAKIYIDKIAKVISEKNNKVGKYIKNYEAKLTSRIGPCIYGNLINDRTGLQIILPTH